MAKHNRNQAPAKKPISSHPLFPAIVAMWFGALFGLGSLAVRASLLESIVIAGHIDTLVPSAAPPLGITARIMLALAMALIGGTLGAMIARWIARPKPVARERRRSAAPAAGSMEKRSNFGLSDPITAQPYAQASEAKREAPAVTGRKRPLTIEENDIPAYMHDAAPLPGGPPQILDVTEFDLADEDFEDAEVVRNAPAIAPYDVQPLDLSAFDSPGGSRFEQAETQPHPAAQVFNPPAGQFSAPASFAAAEVALPAIEAQRSYQPMGIELRQNDDAAETATDQSGAGRFDAPPAFAQSPSVAPARTPVQFEAQPEAEAAPAVFDLSVEAPSQNFAAPPQALQRFAAPDALPGSFAAPPAAVPVAVEPEQAVFEPRAPEAVATHDILRDAEAAPPGEGPAAIVDRLADAEMSAPAETPLPDGRAAQRLVTAVLAELSPVELIERLALTLQNRKIVTTRSEQLASTASPALAAASEPARAFPATAFQAAVETAMPQPAAEPDAERANAAPVPEESQNPFARFEVPPAASPLNLTMPAALRPIDFREYEEADDSLAYVPPRTIALPEAPANEAPAPAPISAEYEPDQAAIAAQHEAVSEAEVAGPEGGEEVAEDAYSSLLDLSRPVADRQQFVRIEEPEEDFGEIEPVVIFPGQAAPIGGRFSAPRAMPAAAQPAAEVVAPADGANVRRFDVPGNAPVAGPGAGAAQPAATAPAQDAAETEQALRSALASLQRMSGAA